MKKILIICTFIVLAGGIYLSLPASSASLASHPDPATDYRQALERIELISASEAVSFNPACQLQLLEHGAKVEKAIVLVHGYTSCPAQFRPLGDEFFQLGYNVLIAPLPHHGLADRMTSEHAQLNARELAQYADEMLDIAHGLGEHVTIMGLSGGGVITAWAAQMRDDLDLAVVASPGFGYYQVPIPLTVPAMNFFRIWPNYYQWWEPDKKEASLPAYSYPRYASHALAEILRLGSAVKNSACREAPASKSILVITNANDTSVNNQLTVQVLDCWREQGARDLRTYEFGAAMKLDHDFISQEQEGQRTSVVYPVLLELINE